jgi:RNA polymerase sigma-70 factor (ECF subfamily)
MLWTNWISRDQPDEAPKRKARRAPRAIEVDEGAAAGASLRDDPDVVLMLKARAGDTEAFATLFRKYGPQVAKYCRRQLGNDACAEDVTQEVFTSLFKRRREYQPTARFSTYLFTIATRLCLNERRRAYYRRRGRISNFDELVREMGSWLGRRPHDTPEEVVVARDGEARLRDALADLSHAQRTAFLLRRMDGMSARDIGGVLKCSEMAARAHVCRATGKLKRAMGPYLEHDPE